MSPLVLCTYQLVGEKPVFHVCAAENERVAQLTGENLAESAKAAGEPELRFAVVKLEPLPV